MGSRLFVGNLPYTCTDADLRSVFEPRWGVIEAHVVTDRETGRSKGFGFVELEAEDAAHAIEALDGREVFGRRMAVREAHERSGGKPRPKRGRVESKPRVVVDTMVRRGGFRPGPPIPEGDGRRWAAPVEEMSEWGAVPTSRAPAKRKRRA